MTTTRSTNKIWLIGNPKSDVNACCLPSNDELLLSCVTFFTFSNTLIQKYCNPFPQLKLLTGKACLKIITSLSFLP